MFFTPSNTEEGASLQFIEINNGKLEITLNAKDDICFVFDVNKNAHSIKLARTKFSYVINDFVNNFYTLTWNQELFKYIKTECADYNYSVLNYSDYIENEKLEFISFKSSNIGFASLSKAELGLLRNTIYSKYNYFFKSENLQKHFSNFSWYQAKNQNVDSFFSNIEKINIQRIQGF